MDVVGEDLDFGNLASVLFEVRNEFPGSDLPNSDLSLVSSGNNKLLIMT